MIMTMAQRENGTPMDTWTVGSQDRLARVIRQKTGLDTQTADGIAGYVAEHGEAAFMTATVLLLDKESAGIPHPAPGRGLARWRAYRSPGWYLALMARDT